MCHLSESLATTPFAALARAIWSWRKDLGTLSFFKKLLFTDCIAQGVLIGFARKLEGPGTGKEEKEEI